MIYSFIIFSFLIKTLYKKVPALWLISIAFIISFLPIFMGNTANYYLTGFFSQLSIISVIFYCYWVFDWRIALNQKKAMHFKLFLLTLSACIFYFHVFSNQFSIYHYGFGHIYSISALFILMCLSIFFKYWFVFCCLSLVLLSFIFQTLESQNIFDYLTDPFLLIILPFTFWRKTDEA